MTKIPAIILALLSIALTSKAQEFRKSIFVSGTDTLHYRLLYPSNYTPSKNYPLVLFLHGSGARGNDNEKQLTNLPASLMDSANRTEYPSFLLVPQCPSNDVWVNFPDFPNSLEATRTPTTAGRLALALVDDLSKKINIDSRRLYITGYSMGGEGTFDLISRRPDLFAAAIPICPVADTSKANNIRHIPIWIFHGDNDKVNDVIYSRLMSAALKQAGANVKYTEYSGIGHSCWNKAYSEPGLWAWLFNQRQ
jgi:predicted peptidase